MTRQLICKICKSEYQDSLLHVCDRCFGPLEVVYDLELVKEKLNPKVISTKQNGIWKYSPLLPVSDPVHQLKTQIGNTQLIHCQTLGSKLGIKNLYVKADFLNPTGSFKDRPAIVAVSKALEFGLNRIGCASTGNLAAATAFSSTKAGLPSYILVPKDLDPTKTKLAKVFGGQVLEIDGNYDKVNRFANYLTDISSIGVVNVNLRPFYVEGSKTITYEVLEQLNWNPPDHILTPLGSGALFTTIDKALKEVSQLGWCETGSVKISGSQPFGCNPIVSAYRKEENILPIENPNTIVKSLAIGDPASGIEVLKLLKERNGFALDPLDDEAIQAQILLAKTEGIFVEGAGGTVIASLIKAVENGDISTDETIVIYLTGIGYKTINSLTSYLPDSDLLYSNYKELENKILEVVI